MCAIRWAYSLVHLTVVVLGRERQRVIDAV
jgi:hypothetical protein